MLHSLPGAGENRKEPQFISPHASVPIGCSFSFEQIQQMAAGKLFGYVMVDASYRDRLDTRTLHKSQSALMLTQVNVQVPKIEKLPAQGGSPEQVINTPGAVQTLLIPSGKHNCADEECRPD
jgi:hypothetical protein